MPLPSPGMVVCIAPLPSRERYIGATQALRGVGSSPDHILLWRNILRGGPGLGRRREWPRPRPPGAADLAADARQGDLRAAAEESSA